MLEIVLHLPERDGATTDRVLLFARHLAECLRTSRRLEHRPVPEVLVAASWDYPAFERTFEYVRTARSIYVANECCSRRARIAVFLYKGNQSIYSKRLLEPLYERSGQFVTKAHERKRTVLDDARTYPCFFSSLELVAHYFLRLQSLQFGKLELHLRERHPEQCFGFRELPCVPRYERDMHVYAL